MTTGSEHRHEAGARELHRRHAPDELQGELRDLLCLAVAGDHVRWAVTGEGAADLTEWLTEAVAHWRDLADEVAKHLVTLDVAPDARVRSLAHDIQLNWVPEGWLRADEARRLVVDRLRGAAERARYRRSQASDPRTRRLLDAVCSRLERSPPLAGDLRPPRSGHEGAVTNDPKGDLMFSLYQAEWCPHSHRVRQRLTELGLEFVAHQVPVDPAERTELEHATGRRSIPTLVLDDGSILGGDDEIIATLDRRYPEPPEAARHRAKAIEEWPEWLRLFGSG